MIGRIFLGRYEAVKLLGEGGMGRVYLAKQLDLGRQVVIKVMHDHIATDAKFCERFQRETLLMARFQHPYAVTLYDASINDPQGPCIVMEYIRGVTLDVLMQRNGRLGAPRVARLLGQLCEVLQAAHDEGIIHRDLKPANLMVVDPETPYEKIKVMDFGLAKLGNVSRHAMKITEDNAEFAIGTPGYMCPEQARGEDMDHRGDLYSVGVILFELLTGKLPFSGTTMDVMLAHATEPPPSFAHVGAPAAVPFGIERLVGDCLAKDPNERPACARDLAERFELALAHEQYKQETAVPQGYFNLQDLPAADGSSGLVATAVKSAIDPNAIVHHLEAWMPEQIAAYKLRGFVQDVGGDVLECSPGLIRVRVGGGRGSPYAGGRQGWFSFGRKQHWIEMELRLERTSERDSLLNITVVLRPVNKESILNPEWRERCGQLFCDLRAYVMGREHMPE